jgi:hypothetical protein
MTLFLLTLFGGLTVLIGIPVAVVLLATRNKPQWPRDLEVRP